MSVATLESPLSSVIVEPAQDLVRIKNLHVTFTGSRRTVHAVRGVDLSIAPGEAVAIVGESGSGKSVTARTLAGLTGIGSAVTADEFIVNGHDALTLSERQWRKIRGSTVGLILQDALVSLDPLRTVGKEIAESLRLHQVVPRKERTRKVHDLLQSVGISQPESRAKQYPHELSGGLRQRALIASALAAKPALIIADEPTTALDVTVQAQVLELLKEHRNSGTALLLISHDLAVVAGIADRIVVMNQGEVVEEGPSQQVLRHPTHEYTKKLLAAVPKINATASGKTPRVVEEDSILKADNVSKSFPAPGGKRRQAVRDVTLDLYPGEKLGIVGESGSGKSTLARLLLGLIKPDLGSVSVNGTSWLSAAIEKKETYSALRQKVQFVAQDPIGSFDPRYTVEEIISEPLRGSGLTNQEILTKVYELMARTALDSDTVTAHPRELSGGQRQRVAIARALATSPDVLVCDEPVSALDVSVQAQILDLLTELNHSTHTSLIFISHDLSVVYQLVDRVVVMKDGKVVESGPVEEVFRAPGHPYTRHLMAAIPSL